MSGFRSLVQGLVQQSFQILGDLTESVVYSSVQTAAYNTSTGATTSTVTKYNFNAVLNRFKQEELDTYSIRAEHKIVSSTDAKLLVAYLDLPVEPNVSDTMVINGRTWKVVQYLNVPGSSLWTLHIRIT